MLRIYYLIGLLSFILVNNIFYLPLVNSQFITYQLKVVVNPGSCIGGEVCGTQPSVSILDSDGNIQLNFIGKCYVQMGKSPSDNEMLYHGGCDYNGCGQGLTGKQQPVSFGLGMATFSGLSIRTAGIGYTLKFSASDQFGNPIAFVYSSIFEVKVGNVFSSRFITTIGRAAGGVPFSPQPVIACTDRGGNTVSSINGYLIQANLTASPYTDQQLLPQSNTRSTFVNGLASFRGLYLNKAGVGYEISFLISIPGTAIPILVSSTFTVSIGSVASLVFDPSYLISFATVQAGEYFKITPRISALDDGGNLITYDSSSQIRVEISDNPSNAKLTPSTSISATLREGIAQFSTLSMDKVGRFYRLKFTLYSYSELLNRYAATKISLYSERFDVVYGPPRKLVNLVNGDRSWAGGQPMEIQPQLQLMDYGKNVLENDFSSELEVNLISSLSTKRVITIDSTSNLITPILSVTTPVTSDEYGTAKIIQLNVNFQYEVYLNARGFPYFNLNVITASGTQAIATFTGSRSKVSSLQFIYTVQLGDFQSTSLSYDGNLILNGSTIVDGNNNTVSTIFPLSGLTPSNIKIDTSQPVVTSLTTLTADGEYGVGENIKLIVTFDKEVIVLGTPYITLSITNSNPSVTSVNAYFSGYSSTGTPAVVSQKNLVFSYIVGPGDSSADLTISNSEIIVLPTGSYIRRKSDNPITDAITTLNGQKAIFQAARAIVIDTTIPTLSTSYGVQTTKANGIYHAGEVIFIQIQFTKPVIIFGTAIVLALNIGNGRTGYGVFNELLSDSKTIRFKFEVPINANITLLDLQWNDHTIPNALILSGSDVRIKRLSTTPTMDANIDTSLLNTVTSLQHQASISLFSFSTSVLSVALGGTSIVNPATLFVDQYAYIDVTFSTKVTFTCDPIIIIPVGVERMARYDSGKGSNVLRFKYTVSFGDSNDGLYYRQFKNALCMSADCLPNPDCKFGQSSTAPVLATSLPNLPTVGAIPNKGIPIATSFTISPNSNPARLTSISKIELLLPPGEYGSGTVVFIEVTFSDEVDIPLGSNIDFSLFLSIGKYAKYSGGSGTNILTFFYSTTKYDATNNLVPLNVPTTNSPLSIKCTINSQCNLKNLIGDDVNMQMPGTLLPIGLIKLDPTPPSIASVYSTKLTSPYDGKYTVGEEIKIVVVYDKPIIIVGRNPRLIMSVGVPPTSIPRYAYYDSLASTTTHLLFVYTVKAGDFSNDLTYIGPTLDRENNLCFIYRKSDAADVEGSYILPTAVPLAINGNKIKIETRIAPKIVSVSSVTSQLRYYAGDTIYLQVTLSDYVILSSRSYINLNMGDHVGKATYTGYNSSYDMKIPTKPTKVLYLSYQITNSDFNMKVDYTDPFCFFLGTDDILNPGTMFAASTNPSLPAVLTLPKVGAQGSLSNTSNLYVDGSTAQLIGLSIINSDGKYGLGSSIDIQMNFSKSVVVTGYPSIKLDVRNTRYATYYSGSGTPLLLFRYVVQPGDMSSKLDYAVDRQALLSAALTFQLNDGSIKVKSNNTLSTVNVFLNPLGGILTGTKIVKASSGGFRYLDLSITKRGPDYSLQFMSKPSNAGQTLFQSQTIFASFSNEFELRPTWGTALIGDLVGNSVGIDDNIAVIGAPHSNLSVTTLQTVTTLGRYQSPVREIQIIRLKVEPQPGIIEFHSSAGIGETVEGYFTIIYGDSGTSRQIPVNADSPMLASIFSYDFPMVGRVSVDREPYIFCACNNAYKWTVTFLEFVEGKMKDFTFGNILMKGLDATVVGPIVLQKPALIGGSFKLKAFGLESNPIPFDAKADDIRKGCLDIGLTVYDIEISPTEKTLARSWTVTFEEHNDWYDIPLLRSNTSLLVGGNISIWHQTMRNGVHSRFGLMGGFKLQWRGNTTSFINRNASADDVKFALETLDVINYVNVLRSEASMIGGYTWTIEFVDVNRNSPRGYFRTNVENCEPIIPINFLIGTDTSIEIGSKWNLGQTNSIYGTQRQGTFGTNAGAVYIYEKSGETWTMTEKLFGNDTNEFDQFGYSVSYKGNLLLVGAIGASTSGTLERQSIFCSASSGYFRLKFRGWQTDPISFNATRIDLIHAIVATPSRFSKLYSINSIQLSDFKGGLCQNNTAVITFLSPTDGDSTLFTRNTGSNLDLLQYEKINMTGPTGSGIINITEDTAGTISPNKYNSDAQQQGAAYLFERKCKPGSIPCKNIWAQIARFSPNDPIGTENFGASVAIEPYSKVAAIGSPGSEDGRGSVYIYTYRDQLDAWLLLQEIIVQEVDGKSGTGFSIAVNGDTLVVGAPYHDSSKGTVIIFKRSTSASKFVMTQTLLPDRRYYLLKSGDKFGSSISIDNLRIVCSASEKDDDAIYFGDITSGIVEKDTGAAFVFERKSNMSDYTFLQRLTPSNVRSQDRFGWAVSISGPNIAVTSVERYDNSLQPSRAIIEVMTTSTYGSLPEDKLSGWFKLTWMVSNDTGTWYTRTTREIGYATTADQMKIILENDLHTGTLIVSRSNVDVYNNGYAWTITFVDQTNQVNIMDSDTTSLLGKNASVQIRFINTSPPTLRGKTHVFQYSNVVNQYVEQLFAIPFSYQPMDRCGWSTAITASVVIVGCPNRDTIVPQRNSGAAIVYDLNLLNMRFSIWKVGESYIVSEGKNVSIVIEREDAVIPSDSSFFLQTIDRNAGSSMQKLLQNLYGVGDGFLSTQYAQTVADVTKFSGSAVARSQFYGTTSHEESVWIDGMYDYRGISDYVPIYKPKSFLAENQIQYEYLISSSDTILEHPDETVCVAIHSPGTWPSKLGKLTTLVQIIDNGDGFVNGKTQFDKVYASSPSIGDHLGDILDSDENSGWLVAGIPSFAQKVLDTQTGLLVSTIINAGKVVIYKRVLEHWVQYDFILSPQAMENGYFGQEVVIQEIFTKNSTVLLVGEVGSARVHVYISEGSNYKKQFVRDTTLMHSDASLLQHQFGGKGTISLDGDLIAIGAPGLEAIYYTYRFYNDSITSWQYKPLTRIRSSNYDYDILGSLIKEHRQEFGKSVAVSQRSIAVGSPYADYNKLGSDLVELDWDTEGTDIKGYGRGKVYIFYSKPSIQVVTINSPAALVAGEAGEFILKLQYRGMYESTANLTFDAKDYEVRLALNNLLNIDDVAVSTSTGFTSGLYYYSWMITFATDFETPPTLEHYWLPPGCPSCTVITKISRPTAIIMETDIIQASDKRNGNKFGWSVALDNDQLAVGAIDSASIVTTSWDFEAGTLVGWSPTGNAFTYQPTYFDNSYLHRVNPGRDSLNDNPMLKLPTHRRRSHMIGNYYISTYDKRPGSTVDYSTPDPDYPQGSIQGDTPTGTLTSDVFMIAGNSINFLIGGGCDYYKVYVELLVDGLSVLRETGECNERMRRANFNVSLYKNRAAQIRIVDISTSIWGHILVDDFKFEWNIRGATYNTTDLRTLTCGPVEAPSSGVVYTFARKKKNSNDACDIDKDSCAWKEEAKLQPSDKRSKTRFGQTLKLNDVAGLLAVGSPNSLFTGFYREYPSLYPYISSTGTSIAANLKFPLNQKLQQEFQSKPLHDPTPSGANGVWFEMSRQGIKGETTGFEASGAVYIFKRDPPIIAAGIVTEAQHWQSIEIAKIQPPDAFARNFFGSAISFTGNTLIVGASGHDGTGILDAGAVYIYNMKFASLSFSKIEYQVLEGTNNVATITVVRDPIVYAGEIIVEVATSDLTAYGVDSYKYDACQKISTDIRSTAGCGDYRQTRETIVIPNGVNSGGADVYIMNNLCRSIAPRYVQLSLSVPGSASLQGQKLLAKIRIDDDDYLTSDCI